MKTKIATLIALTVGLSALHAQSATAPASGRQTGTTQRAKPATSLVVATLDANHDGVEDWRDLLVPTERIYLLTDSDGFAVDW